MKYKLFAVFILIPTLNTYAQPSFELMLNNLLRHSVPEISVDSLAKIQSKVLLLDAREPKEYNVSHLKSAQHVGYDYLNLSSLDKTDKNKRIVVYCSVGYRSEKVAEKIIALGFKNVHNLYGGIFEWTNKGYPVFDATDKTNKVHGYNKIWSIWLKKAEKILN